MCLCRPRYCRDARMRRPISSFEITRFASESARPRPSMTWKASSRTISSRELSSGWSWIRRPSSSFAVDRDESSVSGYILPQQLDRGPDSLCSTRSASMRSANTSAFAIASIAVMPYVSTPGSSGTSASQRPSSSLSCSIVKCMVPRSDSALLRRVLIGQLTNERDFPEPVRASKCQD